MNNIVFLFVNPETERGNDRYDCGGLCTDNYDSILVIECGTHEAKRLIEEEIGILMDMYPYNQFEVRRLGLTDLSPRIMMCSVSSTG